VSSETDAEAANQWAQRLFDNIANDGWDPSCRQHSVDNLSHDGKRIGPSHEGRLSYVRQEGQKRDLRGREVARLLPIQPLWVRQNLSETKTGRPWVEYA